MRSYCETFKRLLLCAVLEFAALTGAPVRPKDIEDALNATNQIKSEQTTDNSGDPP